MTIIHTARESFVGAQLGEAFKTFKQGDAECLTADAWDEVTRVDALASMGVGEFYDETCGELSAHGSKVLRMALEAL